MYSSMLGGGPPQDGAMAPPQPAAMGLGLGAPPKMPDALPPPTGLGAIPTGDPGTTPKSMADDAILSLRAAATAFPSLAQQLNATIDALKSAASSPAQTPPPAAPGGAAPGASPADVPATELSGAP